MVEFVYQDLDETTGTLDELCAWAEDLRKRHGGACKFEVTHPAYRLSRVANADEIVFYEKMQVAAEAQREALERAEFERLSAKFKAG